MHPEHGEGKPALIELPFRQIHLDFHTSEEIPGIGADFDADEFAETLKQANVASITCFSRCHHGWLYHETSKFPERKHPHLTRNLLQEQIEACHARGIRVPIYITVRWDAYTAREHPEWLVVDENGTIIGTKPFEPGFYRQLCINTPFVDFLEDQTAEVCETLPTDGIFFDIVFATPCCCAYCISGMKSEGFDPADPSHRTQYAESVLDRFQKRMYRAVKSRVPEATVFFNSGHTGPKHRAMLDEFTHFELESLPSGGWGYMHFPITMHYTRTLGKQTMGMTGKFHTSWGDFSSFKNPAALEFECMNMLSLGAKCGVGDQLHPSGKICKATYDLIGPVYAKVKALEEWCRNVTPLADIGVFTPEAFRRCNQNRVSTEMMGAVRILQESNHQFDILDSESLLEGYRLLILPDSIPVDEKLKERLSAYLAGGGKMIASHKSGLRPDESGFAMEEIGITYLGDAAWSPDFIVPGKLGAGLADAAHVMYQKACKVETLPGTQILSEVNKPYFNRTWEHYCSHAHTPMQDRAEYPAAVRKGHCIYLAHPVFNLYGNRAPLWVKKLVTNAIDLLLDEPLVLAGGPSSALFTLNHQPEENRLVMHVLHYIPERRGTEFDVIEDIIPIYKVPVSVKAETPAKRVYLAPQREELEFTQAQNRVVFVVPEIIGHQAVVIDLA